MVVERIFISPERGAMQLECEHISLEGGMGIRGDRNFGKSTHAGQNITLVEAEEIEAFCAAHSRHPDLSLTRRNLVTRGVRLNDLVNVEFMVGNVRLRGVELCEPCILLGNSLGNGSPAPAAMTGTYPAALACSWRIALHTTGGLAAPADADVGRDLYAEGNGDLEHVGLLGVGDSGWCIGDSGGWCGRVGSHSTD